MHLNLSNHYHIKYVDYCLHFQCKQELGVFMKNHKSRYKGRNIKYVFSSNKDISTTKLKFFRYKTNVGKGFLFLFLIF